MEFVEKYLMGIDIGDVILIDSYVIRNVEIVYFGVLLIYVVRE